MKCAGQTAYRVSNPTAPKSASRYEIAQILKCWFAYHNHIRSRGAIVVDLDDTLINHQQRVTEGFEHIRNALIDASHNFPFYVVTARPVEDHADVLRMVRKLGFHLADRRLYMMKTEEYYETDPKKRDRFSEAFKWESAIEIEENEGRLLLRMGDRLWDAIPNPGKNEAKFSHIDDRQPFLFFDVVHQTLCVKLPGR
tara:strand:- start:181 stop:771 length:591 start_codon:yes stop_codon:yes gene_type:complete